MARNSWEQLEASFNSDGTAIANSAAEALIFAAITVPGNFLQDGRIVRLAVAGKHSTTGTPTLTFRLRLGGLSGTVIAASAAMVAGAAVANAVFTVEVEFHVRVNGSAGTVMAIGIARLGSGTAPTVGVATGTPAVGHMTAGGQTGPAATTIDLTANQDLAVTAQWGTANAANTLTGMRYTLESLN